MVLSISARHSSEYLSPPERALVLCVDEKTQIQALDRTQPMLPLRPGQAERRTHDYARHGTTSLFAVDVQSGTVIGEFHQRHRAIKFRRFLDTIDQAVPDALEVHLILDNYALSKACRIASPARLSGWPQPACQPPSTRTVEPVT